MVGGEVSHQVFYSNLSRNGGEVIKDSEPELEESGITKKTVVSRQNMQCVVVGGSFCDVRVSPSPLMIGVNRLGSTCTKRKIEHENIDRYPWLILTE